MVLSLPVALCLEVFVSIKQFCSTFLVFNYQLQMFSIDSFQTATPYVICKYEVKKKSQFQRFGSYAFTKYQYLNINHCFSDYLFYI